MRRLFIVAFALLSIQGCRDTDTGVQISGVSLPSLACEYDVGNTLSAGNWDLAAPFGGYAMGPILNSFLVSRSLDTQSESNSVTISEFEVELLRPDGEPLDTGSLPNPYKVATSLVLPVSEGTDPVQGVALAEVVPSAYANAVAGLISPSSGLGQLLINLQAAGSTAGGLSIKTVGFPWVVTVCIGVEQGQCLLDCGDEATEGCTPGQDGVSWCPSVEEPEVDPEDPGMMPMP